MFRVTVVEAKAAIMDAVRRIAMGDFTGLESDSVPKIAKTAAAVWKGGRRPTWNDETRAKAQRMLKDGVPVLGVQAKTGISRALLYRWKGQL